MSSGQTTKRRIYFHTGPILVGKVFQYTGALLVALFIPRMMGPAIFGSFAVYLSLLIFLSVAGGIGTLAIYGRYVPSLGVTGKKSDINKLFTQLVVFKALVSGLVGIVFVFVGMVILPDWPVAWLLVGAITLLLRIVADNSYHLAFGLNFMGRWIARESLRSLVQFFLILALYAAYGLPGAILAIFLTDLVFFLFGFSWSWRYFTPGPGRLSDLWPYLRYGSGFYIAAICMMGFMRGGDIMLASWQIYPAQIAYFNLASNVFFIMYATITQLVMSAIPTLSRWWTQERKQDVSVAINVLWKGSLVVAVVIVILVWLTADFLVLLLFGEAFAPVANYLKLLVLALLPLAIGQMSFVVSVVYGRPRVRLWASVATFVVFVIGSIVLIPAKGAMGTAVASLMAMLAYAATTYLMCREVLRLGGWRAERTFLKSRF